MHCSSSSEAALDEFLEGTLSPVRHARLAAHLAACDACADLLAELRVVDALLLRPRQFDPAPNFSFKVMAEIRAIPAPQAARPRLFAILATYVVFAWAAIGAFLAFGGASARATLALLGTATSGFSTEVQALASASGHLFGRQWFDVTAAMGALLAIDLVCAAAFVAGYGIVRARRAAASR